MKLEEIRKMYAVANKALSEVVAKHNVPDLAAGLSLARGVQKVLKDGIEEVAKTELIVAIKKMGSRPANLASLVYSSGGWKMMMHPTRSGLDPKKVEARIISKGKKPATYMDEVVSYKIPDVGSVHDKALRKLFTVEELVELEYEESWTVKTPTEEES